MKVRGVKRSLYINCGRDYGSVFKMKLKISSPDPEKEPKPCDGEREIKFCGFAAKLDYSG